MTPETGSFRKDLGQFVVAAETTRMAMVFTDATKPDKPIIFANDSFLSWTAYDREEVLGKNFNFLMAHGPDAEALTREPSSKVLRVAELKCFTSQGWN